MLKEKLQDILLELQSSLSYEECRKQLKAMIELNTSLLSELQDNGVELQAETVERLRNALNSFPEVVQWGIKNYIDE